MTAEENAWVAEFIQAGDMCRIRDGGVTAVRIK